MKLASRTASVLLFGMAAYYRLARHDSLMYYLLFNMCFVVLGVTEFRFRNVPRYPATNEAFHVQCAR